MISAAGSRPEVSESTIDDSLVLDLEGTGFQMGFHHGRRHCSRIREFLSDRMCRIGAVMAAPTELSSLIPAINDYRRVIEAELPSLDDEVRGLAEGAEISIDEAFLLQLRRELTGYRKVKAGGDCTTFARMKDGVVVMGQTIDLNGDMERELTVMRLRNGTAGRSVMMVSFTGLLGYLGMNDRGVSICLNLVLGGDWRPGIPGYMTIRHLLDEAGSVDDCLGILKRLPHASSRALTICDARKLVTVEYTPQQMVILESQDIVHANHFLSQQLSAQDALNPFARTSSCRRLDACRNRLGRLPIDADVQQYFQLMGTPPIHVADNGDPRRECTVGAVVMRPDLRKMFVKKGNPALGESRCFTFG